MVARFEVALSAHHGILDKIIGDGVLAIFPARDLTDAERQLMQRTAWETTEAFRKGEF